MRTWVEISRSQLAANYRNIAAAVGSGVGVVGVVKANAYGHGAVEVSRIFVSEGASWLAVSNVLEGLELRQVGIRARILVMGGVFPSERELLGEANLTPVVHSLEELREFDSVGRPVDVHLKVDTGMARLGLRASAQQIADSVRSLRHVRVEGLMSHFACADDPIRNAEQMACFEEVFSLLRPEFIHIASSFAVNSVHAPYNLVRPGIALYGYAPVCNVKPVLTWKARVVTVKQVPQGAPVGYGGRFHAPRNMQTAVIAAGYADGVPRELTNRGYVSMGDSLAPIVGAVSMDLTTVDVTDIPGVKQGGVAEIIGERIDAEDMANATGTISYEILTGIGNRVTRTYVD